MFHLRPAALALTTLVLTAACSLPARAQVWEPGDPPRERYGLPPEIQEVPNVAPDTETMTIAPSMATPAESASNAADAAASEPAAPSPAPRTAEADPEDFLCTRAPAGKAVAVPPPFDRWVVRVCSPRGQALVPVLGNAWVAHNSADPVSILAMPPGTVLPPSTGAFDPRYDIRFESLAGGMTTGERRDRAAALLRRAAGAGKLPAYDEIWQLDAVSNVAETRYNLFLYIAGKQPVRIIACLDRCRQALYLDVLKGEEAKEALAK